MKNLKFVIAALFLCNVLSNSAQIKLPKLISDGMVLQKNEKTNIWGWASPNEAVSLEFKSETYKTKADEKGRWTIKLAAQKAGGPFDFVFKGKNEITVKNILFGDVWICSGQSNMELPMERIQEKYQDIINQANNNKIRQFLVPDTYNFKQEATDFESGNWVAVTPEHVLNFSAVAYFFAQEIYNKYHIPIGLINSALGGSPVESWMSEDALKAFPEAYAEAKKFKDDNLIKTIKTNDKKRSDDWYNLLNTKDQGLIAENQWSEETIDDTNWLQMEIPGYWKNETLGDVNGVVWFRKNIYVPESMSGKTAKLYMGRIVDQDFVYVNGTLVGTTGYQYPPRRYEVANHILKSGKNTIAVRVINNSGSGGFVLDKPYYLAIENDTINLKGTWEYKLGTIMSPLESQTFIRWKPEGLFNAMIAPLLPLKVKGVLWYQGESNTGNPQKYFKTFPALIHNWRDRWNQGDIPFLYVQLTNFMESHKTPVESKWAELRQAQLETLSVPKTGMAVTIDIGEWNDIHPLNKQDVGKRLALLARKIAYGESKIYASSPTPKKATFKSETISIKMKNIGNGLITQNNAEFIESVTVSSDGKHFYKAPAKIHEDSMIVLCHNTPNPTVVRYAWDDNPAEANLFTVDGLPASPFEIKKKK